MHSQVNCDTSKGLIDTCIDLLVPIVDTCEDLYAKGNVRENTAQRASKDGQMVAGHTNPTHIISNAVATSNHIPLTGVHVRPKTSEEILSIVNTCANPLAHQKNPLLLMAPPVTTPSTVIATGRNTNGGPVSGHQKSPLLLMAPMTVVTTGHNTNGEPVSGHQRSQLLLMAPQVTTPTTVVATGRNNIPNSQQKMILGRPSLPNIDSATQNANDDTKRSTENNPLPQDTSDATLKKSPDSQSETLTQVTQEDKDISNAALKALAIEKMEKVLKKCDANPDRTTTAMRSETASSAPSAQSKEPEQPPQPKTVRMRVNGWFRKQWERMKRLRKKISGYISGKSGKGKEKAKKN